VAVPDSGIDLRSAPSTARLSVLGGFSFVEDGRALVTLTSGSQRLLAFLALTDHAVTREQMAGTLYPESSGRHAFASLRSTLNRLDPAARHAVLATFSELCLEQGVTVDLHEVQELAHRILGTGARLADADLDASTIAALSSELLPGWYDDWVLVEAEQWRQLRLHALEALADRFTAVERFGDAVASALAAVRTEPLRESPRGALIRVHLAEGNQSEARREYDRYRALLQQELGLEPTARLRGELDGVPSSDRTDQ
jgi:SARP family transcriptional regulator, regulator of embCAB operon